MNIHKDLKKLRKKIAEELNYNGIEFPVQEKDFNKVEIKIIDALMYLVMKIK